MGFGRFIGEVVAKWLKHSGDDRNMQLLEDFAYVDPDGIRWDAPRGSVVNGASIPSALWNTIGPPFVGDYRRASVVHDVACEVRDRPHGEVHLMFYYAMRADGMGYVKANVMYQAVKRFGPRWGVTGSLSMHGQVSDAEIVAFANAVEEAAQQVDESEGLDAVEARADAILAERLSASGQGAARPKKKATANRKKTKIGIPSYKAASHRSGPQDDDDYDAVSMLMGNASAAVKDQLAGSQLLSRFRQTEMNKLRPLVRSFMSAQSLKNLDPTLTAATGRTEARADFQEDFGDSGDGLSLDDRVLLVNQALALVEQNYVHRPLKESMYGINPVQKLKLLREELLRSSDGESFEGDQEFHRKLLEIFLSMRDLHTNYLLPSPFRETTVFLPFLVEDYFDPQDSPNQRRFLVTKIAGDIPDSSFIVGVEVVRWNGVPIERAVEINGERFAGSNREASRARGLETFTVRPLLQSLPPEEDFVLVEFKTASGQIREIRFDWMTFSPDTGGMAALQQLNELTATAQGIDLEQAMVRWAKRILFAPEAVAAATKMSHRKHAARNQGLQSFLPNALTAESINIDSRDYGYVRIRSFSVNDADQFVREFIRLVEQLPQDGLIIDVRGNGGGLILAGEQLLQVLTPHRIDPTLFQLLVTPLNRLLVDEVGFLAQWRKSMRQAVQTGAAFTQGFPITSTAKANEIGQRYFGPVVLITDALCYSTTDIFAAGFQDHEIGTIIGSDNATGAGGANVWSHDLLLHLLQNNSHSPYKPLPSNADMRVSIRRTIRVGKSNGTVLEDFGVVPDILHPMSRDDLLNDNIDLLAMAAQIINEKPARFLNANIVSQGNDVLTLEIETEGIDRVDIFAGSRPWGSIDVEDGLSEVDLDGSDFDQLRLQGYEGDQLVASRVI